MQGRLIRLHSVMKDLRITPRPPLERTIDLPTSKSISHRALILSALNTAMCTIDNLLAADDTAITSEALRSLGVDIKSNGTRTEVHGIIGHVGKTDIFLGNSGSSARFLLPLGAFGDRSVTYSGTPRLVERPFHELLSTLRSLGYQIDSSNDSLPVTIHPCRISGGTTDVQRLPSSQIISALMMASLWMDNGLSIRIGADIPSMAYARMTFRLMQFLKLPITWEEDVVTAKSHRPRDSWTIEIEKDMSAASYWVAYALLTGVRVFLKGARRSSLQGDTAIFDAAEMAGATVRERDDGIDVVGTLTRTFDIDAYETPDVVPTLAVIGMFAPDTMTIRNVHHLKYKESDRIAAIQQNIQTLGGHSEYTDGDLRIIPRTGYTGGRIATHDDHRIAMSFAMAGLRIPGVIIENPDCVAKSYPRFWQDFDEWEDNS